LFFSSLLLSDAVHSERVVKKATQSGHQKAFDQLVDTSVPSALEFKSDPPVLVPLRELMANSTQSREEFLQLVNDIRRAYRRTLSEDRRHLLEQYELQDVARKVVGVGSVGTRCFAMLLKACDPNDVLILQLKEASKSVIEEVITTGPKVRV
jgi:hypothetical protein